MRYAVINQNGAIEVRQDSLTELPAGAVEVTEYQINGLLGEVPNLTLRNGEIVVK